MNDALTPYLYYGCGCDFEYKENCYFYGETHDMGATIRYCTRKEIKWGDCPCENCHNFLSKSEADKIVRKTLLE